MPRGWKSDVAYGLVLGGLCALFFFYRLGDMALIGPDEPRYAQVAREMLARGDLITPTLGGAPWLEKPALTYWLMALSMKIFGLGEFAARFPSASLATALAFFVYLTGRRVHSSLYGFLSASLCVVNPMSFGFARGATTDMPLAATLGAGMCLLFLATEEAVSRRHALLISGAGLCFGLAVLAKGAIGILFPMLILGSYLWLRKRRGAPVRLRLAWGGILFFIACGSWYGPMILRHGWSFVHEFFISHHIYRYVTERFHHPGPPYYYLPVLIVGLFPWTPLFFSALWRLLGRHALADPQSGLGRMMRWAGLWVLWPLLFFSFSESKLPGYLLPVIPAAAFWGAGELLLIIRSAPDRLVGVEMRVLPIFFLGISLASLLYAERELGDLRGMNLLLIGSLVGATAALFLALLGNYRGLLLLLFSLCVVGTPGILSTFQPTIEKKESFRDLALVACHELRPGEKLIAYRWFHHTLTFYTNARTLYDERGQVRILFSLDELFGLLRESDSALVVTRQQHVGELKRDKRFQSELIWVERGVALLRVNALL